MCVWKQRWLSGLDSTAWLDLLDSALLWQAIIRRKAGTRYGRQLSRRQKKEDSGEKKWKKERRGGGLLMEKVNATKKRRRRGRQSRSEGCLLVCLFTSSAPSLMRLAWQGKNATLGNSGHMKIG